jgi:hypothetical protein
VLNQLQLTRRVFSQVLISVMLIGLGGCPANQTASNAPQPPVSPSATTPSPIAATTPDPAASANAGSSSQPLTTASPTPEVKTIPVTIYKADSQCANFEPEQVQVSEERSLEAAVGKVIQEQSSADFDLSGYRVNQDADGVVTIDFRLAPNSQRQFTSLSTCEQFALFGSLRETLTRNPQWNVKSIRFTNRGEEIVL